MDSSCQIGSKSLYQRVPVNAHRSPETPRLLVDISELIQHDAQSGIQRVTKSILLAWTLAPPQGYQVVPVYDIDGVYRYAYRFFDIDEANKKDLLKNEIVEGNKGDIFFGLDLNFSVIRNQSVFQSWHNHGVKICFMIYDLLPLLVPEMFDKELPKAFSSWLNVVADVSDLLICISQAVADELVHYLSQEKIIHKDSLRITWNALGANLTHSVSESDLSKKDHDCLVFLRARPTFLKVATLEPRKGHDQVLAAFESLWSTDIDINLVFVGKIGWNVDGLVKKLRGHPENGKRLFWLEGISDESLEMIYSTSTCLIMASIGEGFGLPLVEAAKHNLPIIVRDIPVFREVAGDHAFYFKGRTSEDLTKVIRQWLNLHRNGSVPQSSQIPWRTWEKSAQQLMEIILSREICASQ